MKQPYHRSVGIATLLSAFLLPVYSSHGQVWIDLTGRNVGDCGGALTILLGPTKVTAPFTKTVQTSTAGGCEVLIAGKYNIDNLPTGDSSGNDIEIFNINGTAAVEFTETRVAVGEGFEGKHQMVLKNARIRNAVTTRSSLADPVYIIVPGDLIVFERLGAETRNGDHAGTHTYGGAWRATDDLGRTSTSTAEGFLCGGPSGPTCPGATAFIPPLAGNLSGARRLTASISGNDLGEGFGNEPLNRAFIRGKISVGAAAGSIPLNGLKPPVRNQSTGAITNDEYLDATGVLVSLDNVGANIGGGGVLVPCDEVGKTDSSGELVCVELWQGLTFMQPSAAISALQIEHCPVEFENKCVKKK